MFNSEYIPAAGFNNIAFPGTQEDVTRQVLLYLPLDYDATKEYKFIFMFHGSFSNPTNLMYDSNMHSHANTHGFILAGVLGHNQVWSTGHDTERDSDIKFVEKIKTYANQKFKVKDDTFFSVGFSGGAIITSRMACEFNDISAIVTIAGIQNLDTYCQGNTSTSVLAMHGKDDGVNYYDHKTTDPARGTDWPLDDPVLTSLRRFAASNGCDINTAKETEVTGIVDGDHRTVEHKIYDSNCRNDKTVELYTVSGYDTEEKCNSNRQYFPTSLSKAEIERRFQRCMDMGSHRNTILPSINGDDQWSFIAKWFHEQ
eukprot:Pgem_evm1s18594